MKKSLLALFALLLSTTSYGSGFFGGGGGGGGGVTDHGALTGLADDDHAQYTLLAGRAGGQLIRGGTGSGDDLQLQSTANATRGLIEALDDFHITRSASGGLVEGRIVNLSNTASSNARLRIDTGGSTGGVPYLYLRAVNVSRDASIGIDNDLAALVKFTHQDGLGANVAIQYDADLDVTIPGGDLSMANNLITNTASIEIDDASGQPYVISENSVAVNELLIEGQTAATAATVVVKPLDADLSDTAALRIVAKEDGGADDVTLQIGWGGGGSNWTINSFRGTGGVDQPIVFNVEGTKLTLNSAGATMAGVDWNFSGTGAIFPQVTNLRDLGKAANLWRNVFIHNSIQSGTDVVNDANPASNISVRAKAKLAGTGDGGDLELQGGFSTGGFAGIVAIDLGPLAYDSEAITIISDGQTVTPDQSLLVLDATTTPATAGTVDLQDGRRDGQILDIVFNEATFLIEILDTGNQCLSATWTPTNDDTLSLVWSTATSCWHEKARSVN